MKKLQTSTRNTERGQSLLELAISLVVLLMLLTGAVEFGLALFQYVTIRDAAQEGAVYGSIKPDDEAGIKLRAADAASDILILDPDTAVVVLINGQTVTAAVAAGEACEGQANPPEQNSIEVTVTYLHPVTFPFVADMIGYPNIQLQGRATTTILQPVCP